MRVPEKGPDIYKALSENVSGFVRINNSDLQQVSIYGRVRVCGKLNAFNFFFPQALLTWAQCQLEGISVKCPLLNLKSGKRGSIATFQRKDHQHEVGSMCEKLRQKVLSISYWTLNSMFGSSGRCVGKRTMPNTDAAKFRDLSSLNHFCKLRFIRVREQCQTVDRSLKHVPRKLGQTVAALMPKTFCLNSRLASSQTSLLCCHELEILIVLFAKRESSQFLCFHRRL